MVSGESHNMRQGHQGQTTSMTNQRVGSQVLIQIYSDLHTDTNSDTTRRVRITLHSVIARHFERWRI